MYEDLISENLVDVPEDIERVIEGDARHSGNESDGGDEQNKSGGEDDKDQSKDSEKKPKVRKSMGPRVVLNAERLIGPRGISIMESFFSDVKLQGKGKEKEDLDVVMKRLELWTHRMAPRFHFDDSLKKIEKLGSKKVVATHLKIARYGRNDDVVAARGLADEVPDSPPPSPLPTPVDPFDQLIAASTPAHPVEKEITSEQREQMLRNRLIAEERRAARIKKAQEMKMKFQAQYNDSLSQAPTQPEDLPVNSDRVQSIENTASPTLEHDSQIIPTEINCKDKDKIEGVSNSQCQNVEDQELSASNSTFHLQHSIDDSTPCVAKPESSASFENVTILPEMSSSKCSESVEEITNTESVSNQRPSVDHVMTNDPQELSTSGGTEEKNVGIEIPSEAMDVDG